MDIAYISFFFFLNSLSDLGVRGGAIKMFLFSFFFNSLSDLGVRGRGGGGGGY